jgi:Electron transfer DM13
MGRIRSTIVAHPLIILASATLTLAAAVFVLLYFEPQKLFIDDRVDEALPTASDTAQTGEVGVGRSRNRPRELASGEFRGLEHRASGRALLLEIGSDRYLRFEDLDTSNGPDLRVYLSQAPAEGEEGAFDDNYVELGELKGNIGSQNYAIPDSVDLSRFRSAVVWCKRFSAGFAVAPVELRS